MAKSAGFLGKHHTDKTREKIKVTQIVNRMVGYALGEKDAKTGDPIEMDAGQLRAAEILLRKALPDLTAVAQDITSSDGTMSKPLKIILEGVSAGQTKDT